MYNMPSAVRGEMVVVVTAIVDVVVVACSSPPLQPATANAAAATMSIVGLVHLPITSR